MKILWGLVIFNTLGTIAFLILTFFYFKVPDEFYVQELETYTASEVEKMHNYVDAEILQLKLDLLPESEPEVLEKKPIGF